MLYFAYGSNMDFEQMRKRCPSTITITKASLLNHRLAFTRFSDIRNGGVADVIPSETELVEGVTYDISDEDTVKLDVFENVAEGFYSRMDVRVTLPAGEIIEVFTYKATEEGEFKPTKAYMAHLINGAKYHGLSSEYTASLEAIETCD
ncbi:MAG: gamma-glutamylcyclotransferase [Candidatus Coatesbacteria bacterium]|nr:gamma-glutamylcyclotransferase [Candidatus Coatesbacteria bacterium]